MEAIAMPMSNDVKLPKEHKPLFPDRCVACGRAAPGDSIRIGTDAIGWWTPVLWLPGARFSVDIPACGACRRAMSRQRWLRLAVCGVFIAVGTGLAHWTLGSFRGIKRWAGMGITLLCLVPWFAWEIFSPPTIGLTAYSNAVVYEFRDASYAEEFAALNDGNYEAS
jgi:hypothetical protein